MRRRGEDQKKRADSKHKYLLSIEQRDFKKIRAIAFNADISYQKVIEMLLVAALENDHLIDRIYAAYPPNNDDFIIVREER